MIPVDEFTLSVSALVVALCTGGILFLALIHPIRVLRSFLLSIAASAALLTIAIFVNQAVNYLAAVTP